MAHEKDEKIKVPSWYMKLPIGLMEKISVVITKFVKAFPAKKRKKGISKIQFYI